MKENKLKKLPEVLEDSCFGLTFKEKRDLKAKGVSLKNLKTDEEEEDAIVALMKLREVKERDVLSVEYAVILAWLMRVMTNTFNPMEDEAKKK